ncbi:hypothetical protein ISCGN_031994 [Ixodes scapularis]
MDLLNEEHADIIFLQETKICSAEKAKSFVQFFGHIFWSVHTLTSDLDRAGGTAVLIRKSTGIRIAHPELCADGRFALVDVLIGNELTRLISVYAPSNPSERKDFFIGLRTQLETPATLVVGGDFNCVLNGRDRVRGSTVPRIDVGANTLRDAVRDFDLVDVTQVLGSFSPRFTRWLGASQARLDRVYVSSELSDGVQSYDAKIVPFSDHGFVATVLRAGAPVAERARLNTTWKMNASVLESEEFVGKTRCALERLVESGVDAVTWESFKANLRESACAFGRRRAAEARETRIHLAKTLRMLLEEEEQNPGTFADDIKNCKEQLLGILEERYRGAQVRSRVQALEGEIQPCKIFRTHERQRVRENTLREVRGERGVATSQQEIAGAFEEAFGRLFQEENLDETAFESILHESPTVPEEASDLMNRPIRLSEVKQAIKRLSRNKAPGPDGIGAEHLSFFNRAYVCNAVIYPAVLYKAQAVCCPGVTAKRIHRSWAVFVWKSSMERTRRENLFLHQEGGGLGLVNIVLKLHVQRFLLFRDAKDPVLLSALHHLGFPHLGRWMVTTSGRTAKAAALRFYSEIAASIEFFLARFSWDYLATVGKRKLYWDTISVTFPSPLYRPPPVLDGTAGLFKLVRRLPVSAASKDFFVRMHLEVLPVKTWLHRRGIFVPWSLNCDLCGVTETIQHVLVECSNAYLFWDEMRTIFNLRTAFDVDRPSKVVNSCIMVLDEASNPIAGVLASQ